MRFPCALRDALGFAGYLLAGLCLAASAACGSGTKQPDILLITATGVRADYLGAYGSRLAPTPNADALAAEGLRFERCYTPSPDTLAGAATIHTGRYPSAHGAHAAPYTRLNSGVPVLAEALRSAGYQTAAFVSSHELAAGLGLSRGFDVYDAKMPGDMPPLFSQVPLRRHAADTAAACEKWLKEISSSKPCFAWVEISDTTLPYFVPPEMEEKHRSHLYLGAALHADEQLGRLREAFRRARGRNTVTVFTSEHGQGLSQHGERGHGLFAFDTTLRVPLVMAWPGGPQGETVAAPAGLDGLAPALAGLAGAEWKGGESLLSLKDRETAARPPRIESYAVTLRYGWKPLLGIGSADGAWKYLDSPAPALYWRESGEEENLLFTQPAMAETLRALYRREAAASGPAPAAPGEPVRRALERMRLSGTWEASMRQEAWTGVADPVVFLQDFEEVQRRMRAGEPGALARAEAFYRGHPRNPAVLNWLATVYFVRKMYEEAEPLYGLLASLRPSDAEAWNYLGLARLYQGHPGDARVCLEAARHLDPAFPGYVYNLGDVALHEARYEEAASLFEEAIRMGGASSPYHYRLAAAYEAAGKKKEALAAYRLAWRGWQGSADQRDFIGAAVRRLGRELGGTDF